MTHREHNPELFDIAIKVASAVIGILVMILIGLVGWCLQEIYSLGSTVATHTVLLSDSKDDIEQIKQQVQAIYMSRQWRQAATTTSQSNTNDEALR